MKKTAIRWQAKPACKRVLSSILMQASFHCLVCVLFSFLVYLGYITADSTFPKVAWLVMGSAAVVYSIDALHRLCKPIVRKLKTQYILTSDTLFIKVGKVLEVAIPYNDSWTPYLVKKKQGLVDVHLVTASGMAVVLSDIRRNAELDTIFSMPQQVS